MCIVLYHEREMFTGNGDGSGEGGCTWRTVSFNFSFSFEGDFEWRLKTLDSEGGSSTSMGVVEQPRWERYLKEDLRVFSQVCCYGSCPVVVALGGGLEERQVDRGWVEVYKRILLHVLVVERRSGLFWIEHTSVMDFIRSVSCTVLRIM